MSTVLRRISNRRQVVISGLLLLAWGNASGCITTLGYVPEFPKTEDKKSYKPTYTEVRKWAYDVMDGYDSRATMNRQALYGGALLAAASLSALTGLLAFDSTSSALKAIPIGAAFLGGAAGIYSNEEKALIFGRASSYAKTLINFSDNRLKESDAPPLSTATVVEAVALATEKETSALAKASNAQAILAKFKTAQQEAQAKVDAASDAAERTAAQKSFEDATKRIADQEQELRRAQAASRAATARKQYAARRAVILGDLIDAQTTLNQIKIGKRSGDRMAQDMIVKSARQAWKEITNDEDAEAFCLRRDISALMDHVRTHIELLDPKNVAAQLKGVKTQPSSSTTSESEQGGSTVTPGDYSDLDPPKSSECIGGM